MSNDTTLLPEMSGTPISPQGRARGLRLYRANHPRVDYYPSQRAKEAIDNLRKRCPTHCTASLIDALVLEGAKTLSGNRQGQG